MTGCLTQHEVNVSLWIISAALTTALVASTVAAATWAPANLSWRAEQRRLPLLVLGAGLLLFLAVRGQFWLIGAMLPAAALVAVAGVTLHRVSAEGPDWRRTVGFARLGLFSIAACSLVMVAVAAAWVVPADICS